MKKVYIQPSLEISALTADCVLGFSPTEQFVSNNETMIKYPWVN